MPDAILSSQTRHHRAAVLVLSVLLMALCPAAYPETGVSPSVRDLGDLLSTPMPGTRAREAAELVGRLERALSAFTGVDSVSVIVSQSSEDVAISPSVAVQMSLSDGFAPTPAWLRAICAICLRTIPHLDQQSLTIVESSGRILYDSGEVLLAPPPAAPVIDATFSFEPWWLWIAAAVGFLLVVAGVMTHRALRQAPEPRPEPRDPGPLDFLEHVPDEQIATALAQERPEVIAVVLSLAPQCVAARIERNARLPAELPTSSSSPDPAMTAALARVLREKLVGT